MSVETTTDYQKLRRYSQDIEVLRDIQSLLRWDNETMMPEGALASRIAQNALLERLIHQKITQDKCARLLEKAESNAPKDKWVKRNIGLWRKQHQLAKLVPGKLLEKISRQMGECLSLWQKAKEEESFILVQASLSELFKLTYEQYSLQSEYLKCTPYEAAMQQYSEGLSIEYVDGQFQELKTILPHYIQQICDQQSPAPLPLGHYDLLAQKALCKELMELMGFDFMRGRFDESSHPFCGGATNDVRLTACYREDDLMPGVFGTIHETGHALYEQNLPKEHQFTPVGRNAGMAIHESQSLFMEFQIGGDERFLHDLHGLISKHFPEHKISLDALCKHRRLVQPSYYRIHADEVTYPLHVILRYELEKDLFNGKLAIQDVKEAWATKFKAIFALEIENDNQGCLQDIHWYWGIFGYFPSYTIGAMLAAQLRYILQARGVEYKSFSSFQEIRKELHLLVHQVGNLPVSDLLMQLDSAANNQGILQCFKQYLQNKYNVR